MSNTQQNKPQQYLVMYPDEKHFLWVEHPDGSHSEAEYYPWTIPETRHCPKTKDTKSAKNELPTISEKR